MKSFVLLFSLYFVSLAFIPCQDREAMTIEKASTSIQTNQSADHQDHQDDCPPFCSCYCCSTARQITAVASQSIFSNAFVRLYPGYATSPILKQPIDIWQPPQIA